MTTQQIINLFAGMYHYDRAVLTRMANHILKQHIDTPQQPTGGVRKVKR